MGAGQEQVIFDLAGFQIIAVCTATTAELRVHSVSSGVNIVSDSRNISQGLTLGQGGPDVTIGTAGAIILDRGEFNLVALANGTTLNGSFYILFVQGAGCQYVASAITSSATSNLNVSLQGRQASTESKFARVP